MVLANWIDSANGFFTQTSLYHKPIFVNTIFAHHLCDNKRLQETGYFSSPPILSFFRNLPLEAHMRILPRGAGSA